MATEATGPEIESVIEALKRDIDRTLLRENLRKSVDDRVRALAALLRLANEAWRAGHALRKPDE